MATTAPIRLRAPRGGWVVGGGGGVGGSGVWAGEPLWTATA
ncbi:hypothetical protein [Nocardia abscessus]|nr:hypothetical protein [Nocardia abscessus]